MNTTDALKLFEADSLDTLTNKSLKTKYHKLAKIKHPDKNSGNHKDFVELKEAYNLLQKELENIDQSQNVELENLDKLSKEEILDKYKETSTNLTVYRSAVTNQIFSLDLTNQNVTTTISKYKKKKNDLKSDFESDLTRLEKEVYPNFFRRMLFFVWPTIDEVEFWEKFARLKSDYVEKESRLNKDFYEDLIINLTTGINQISSTIQKIDAK